MTDLHFVLRSYPMMSLRDIVLFPHMVAPLVVGRKKSIQALEEAIANHSEIFLATQKNASDEDPKQAGVHTVGTVAGVLQLLRLPDGTIKALVEGRRRARIIRYLPHEEFFRVEVEELLETGEINAETEAFVRQIRTVFGGYVKHSKKIPPEVVKSLANIADPARFVDVLVSHLPLATIKKQEILSAFAIQARLEIALSFLNIENEIVSMEETIRTRVKKKMEKSQKDYYLAEQIRALQKEMGADNDAASELDELDKQIRRKKLPQAARAKVKREFKKLKLMQPMSAEATVVRNYIDVILSLPWSEKSRERVEILAADAILEEDHFGLAKPKERILEYLAVQAQVKTMRGPILCLVGPPGVGKTSLCKSVARAMGRKFVRLSLGGVRDEAEISGHRRTYIGAMPGKIIQSLRKAKVNNPVFCLDEVDKMSMDFRGDPSAALLEVLDPEQNNAFNDHYLDLDFDLSDVFFITTANNLPSIPPPLRDRMEIIKLEGYTEEDKLRIATDFLVPKQLAANGFTDADIVFNDKAILEVVQRYTREAGVRNLERSIAAICRKIARDRLKNGADKKYRVPAPAVARYLGVPRYRVGQAEDIDRTGLVTGLAWTEVGGELLQIEAVLMPGKGKLIITGKLGEVMQESAQAALSYVRSRALRLGLAPDFYQKVDIHVHVPEGAIPKDGPSAGITMATAIASALLQLPVRKDIAMTGEITLRVFLLNNAGPTEKLLAARRGHIRNVLVPKENERDLEEIPAKIRKSLRIDLVENMDEVLTKALVLGEGATLFKEVSMAAFCPEVMLPVDTPIAHQ